VAREVQVSKAQEILAGLGGGDNIVTLEPCITRLRVELRDASRLDERRLRAAGAFGVLKVGNAVQVVVGPQADTIEQEMRRLMKG
jgi:N-acetylglucosamine PTS system EIIB component